MDRNIARWPKPFFQKSCGTPSAETPFDQEDAETRAIIHHYFALAEKLLPRHPFKSQAEEENAA